MKLHPFLLPLIALLPACNPSADPETARLEMEKNHATYEQQAAELQRRSEDMQRQLADLEQAMRDKENAELRASLEAIKQENAKLMADADEARRKNQQLRDQLASQPVPKAVPYIPPTPTAPSAPATNLSPSWSEPAADYSMFYDSLRTHGRWLEVSGYGYAFRPSQADRPNWRPYVDGRWVWTDRGWTWSSQEPFGWACYHYGRWVRVSRHGWIWIPGREWAPAWVSWRHGRDFVGWAPLPPGASARHGIGHDCDARYSLAPSSYTFISASDFGRRSYVNCGLPTTRVTTVFQQTVNVTSIVYVSQQSTCIQRGGPAIDWVEKQCRTRVPRATVRLADRPAPIGPRADRDQPSFVAAPVPLAMKDGPRHTPVIAERIQQPVLLDGWKDVPKDQQVALRETIAHQSRQPAPQLVLTESPTLITPNQPGGSQTSLAGENPQPSSPRGNLMNELPAIVGQPTEPNPEPNSARSEPNVASSPSISVDNAKAAELERQFAGKKADLAQQQAEAEAMQKQMIAEQHELEAAAKEKQAAEMNARASAALREKQEAEMLAQQQELTRKQAEAMRQEIEEQEKQAASMRAAQDAEAAKAAEMAAAQQREAQMRAQQEAAERQALVETQQREAAMRTQQEAEMRARQEEAERQRQMEIQRQQQEAAMRAQQEAEMRARQEEAERQRQMEIQRQQQEAAQRPQSPSTEGS
jgi:hypothetical protein